MAKGMILAAVQGSRVRPLTKDFPKPMVPILGKPVMEYLIEHLARYGITEIMINVAFNHKKIEEYFGDGHRWGVNIGYAFEGVYDHGEILPRPKGSAGGMKAIHDFSGFFDETALVICGDAIVDLDLGAAACREGLAVLCAEPLLQLDRHRPGNRLLVGAAARAARRSRRDEHARQGG
jgi:mannose-1-phosphate guanylyltransferase